LAAVVARLWTMPIDESWSCVDETGGSTCGKYAGEPSALIFAPLLSDHERIRRLATRGALIRQGEQSLALASINGDLDAVKILIEMGALHGLLDENVLERSPLFEGGDDQGAFLLRAQHDSAERAYWPFLPSEAST
jgi:hypothetical protein